MIVFIKAINRHTAVKHNAEHTDVLKKLKTVLVQYTIHKTALINIIYFRGKFVVMRSRTCAIWCTALGW